MPFPPIMGVKAMVSNVAHAYQLVLNNPAQLIPMEGVSRGALEAAYDNVAHFSPMVNRQFNVMLNFLRGLDVGGAPAQRVQTLRQINQVLNARITILPPAVGHADWVNFGNALNAFAVLRQPRLAALYATRAANTALTDMRTIYAAAHNAGGRGQEALSVMATVMEENGVPGGITAATIVALMNMLAQFAPRGGFAGFTQWGPGDNANPAANLEAHVRKHVCRDPLDVEFGVSETMAWWALLNVQLTLQDYEGAAVNPMPQARFCFDGANPLAGDRLKRFLVLQAFTNEAALTTLVVGRSQIAYGNYAINQSAHMANVIVQSNGVRVFISGSYNGQVFIIGRFDGAQLGISSAYIPLDLQAKLDGAASNICWALI